MENQKRNEAKKAEHKKESTLMIAFDVRAPSFIFSHIVGQAGQS